LATIVLLDLAVLRRSDSLVSGDLEGAVYMWRLPCGGISTAAGHDDGDDNVVRLVGRYSHRDWVRSVDLVDGVVVSSCKTGEIKHAAFPTGSDSSGDGPDEVKMHASWALGERMDSQGSAQEHHESGAGNGSSLSTNQAFSIAADCNGVVAGCHDKSIRLYWFTKDGNAMCF
jgi:hypothetical protein